MAFAAQAYSHIDPEENRQSARPVRAIDFGGLARRVLEARARRAQESAEINVALAGLTHIVPANDDAPVREVVTKPAPRTRRKRVRSGLRQRDDARDMRTDARPGAGQAVEHLPTPSPTTSTSSTTKTKTGRGRMIASWKDAGDLPRAIAINRGLDRFGVPMAFSLNLDPKLIRAGNDNARGLLDYVRRRVALGLKRTLGEAPPMWVAIETDDDGRPHLHGGIALTDRRPAAVILGALSKAGGDWTRPGSAPADLRVQHDPDGWAVYPFKRAARTRRDLGTRGALYAVSAELLAEGKRLHEEARRSIGRR